MSLARHDQALTIHYPETDGKPMAETDVHIQLMIDLRFSLKEFFRNEPDVYVGSNLLLYYVQGDPSKRVAPDVFVVRGVSKGDRRTYKLWGRGPAARRRLRNILARDLGRRPSEEVEAV